MNGLLVLIPVALGALLIPPLVNQGETLVNDVPGYVTDVEDFVNKHKSAMGQDIDEAPVFLGKSSWEIGYVTERFPKIRFERTRERG